MPIMNVWEASALEYNFQDDGEMATSTVAMSTLAIAPKDNIHDPIIYPGLYAPSGFDMMNILMRIVSRPNPVIDVGPVDASCAIIMCDLQQPDCPVVYANDACVELTGYSQPEMLGRNCRFLQAPGGKVRKSSARKYIDKDTIKTMRRAVESNNEIFLEVTNFKRSGQKFINMLAMIPVYWDSVTPRYSVGLMAEKNW